MMRVFSKFEQHKDAGIADGKAADLSDRVGDELSDLPCNGDFGLDSNKAPRSAKVRMSPQATCCAPLQDHEYDPFNCECVIWTLPFFK